MVIGRNRLRDITGSTDSDDMFVGGFLHPWTCVRWAPIVVEGYLHRLLAACNHYRRMLWFFLYNRVYNRVYYTSSTFIYRYWSRVKASQPKTSNTVATRMWRMRAGKFLGYLTLPNVGPRFVFQAPAEEPNQRGVLFLLFLNPWIDLGTRPGLIRCIEPKL